MPLQVNTLWCRSMCFATLQVTTSQHKTAAAIASHCKSEILHSCITSHCKSGQGNWVAENFLCGILLFCIGPSHFIVWWWSYIQDASWGIYCFARFTWQASCRCSKVGPLLAWVLHSVITCHMWQCMMYWPQLMLMHTGSNVAIHVVVQPGNNWTNSPRQTIPPYCRTYCSTLWGRGRIPYFPEPRSAHLLMQLWFTISRMKWLPLHLDGVLSPMHYKHGFQHLQTPTIYASSLHIMQSILVSQYSKASAICWTSRCPQTGDLQILSPVFNRFYQDWPAIPLVLWPNAGKSEYSVELSKFGWGWVCSSVWKCGASRVLYFVDKLSSCFWAVAWLLGKN